MSGFFPLSLSTTLYFWTAACYFRSGDLPMALTFIAYSVANLGFLWQLWLKE